MKKKSLRPGCNLHVVEAACSVARLEVATGNEGLLILEATF
ncbi:MAG: hypothetical protein M0T74_15605 [Desulfitobacterium hafniense]|nr:hypothetical protein [Desulfitobacterium hafniense]